jgi:predicted enzyme related to lactoylglutathione lyase
MPAPRGTFIWYDVMRNDTKAATEFYSDVIGWDAQEHAMPDNRTYTNLQQRAGDGRGADGDLRGIVR